MTIELSQFRELYLQESTEHIASMEAALLELRERPGDLDLLHAIFRSAHSIKGGAGSFGLEQLVRFTHTLEGLLDRLRTGMLTITPPVIDTLLQSVDVLTGLLPLDAAAPMPEAAEDVLHVLHGVLGSAVTVEAADVAGVGPAAGATAQATYRVHFKPAPALLESGSNPLLLLRNLAALGAAHECTMHTESLPQLQALNPALFYLSWTMTLETTATEAEVREVFEFVEDQAEVEVTCVAAPQAAAAETREATKVQPADPPVFARAAAGETTVRVPIDKVDRLIDLVGELVIAQAMAEQMTRNFTPEVYPQLCEAIARLEQNTRELHERVMSIRMLPIGSLFRRYTRTVYDIGKSTGKEARVEFAGEETEIDKSMLELLADPLIHLIRNAVDHGVEEPSARIAAGKPREGTIVLRASHRSGKIVIVIEDDGAGIDPVRVRAKAIQRGLITSDAELNDAQLHMLIFEPGFSTRDEASDLSGRGVGMDVVKRNIQQMNGTVHLESQVGRGSRITIELPLTLTIMEGLIIRVQGRKLVLPLLSVVETISFERAKLTRIVNEGEVFTVRGQAIPLLRLANYLQLPTSQEQPSCALIVVVEAASRKLGLVIDEVLGQQQVVLKSLERHLHRVDGLLGATILGDGRVAPILDVATLSELDLFSSKGSEGRAHAAATDLAA